MAHPAGAAPQSSPGLTLAPSLMVIRAVIEYRPMETLSEGVRKATTVLLAAFLWLHALFFLNFHSVFISKFTQLLHLSTSEVILFGLLLIFSFAAGSGFWKPLRSVAYIYAF